MNHFLEVIYNEHLYVPKNQSPSGKKRLMITPVWNDIFIKHNLNNRVNTVFLQAYQYFPEQSPYEEDVMHIITKTAQELIDKFYPANAPTASPEEVKKTCAELYGLVSYYEKDFSRIKSDKLIFLTFESLSSERAAELIHTWTQLQGWDAKIIKVSKEAGYYGHSLDDLVVNLPTTLIPLIEKYREQGYEIIFNMSSSYPQLLDNLNMLASLFGDEILFSSNTRHEPRFRVSPRYPLAIERKTVDQLRKHLLLFRKLQFFEALPLEAGQEELRGLVNIVDNLEEVKTHLAKRSKGKASRMNKCKTGRLVIWETGARKTSESKDKEDEANKLIERSFMTGLVWYKVKDQLYSEKLWEPATDKINYSEDFIKAAVDLSSQELREVNQTVDMLHLYFHKKTKPHEKKSLARLNLVKVDRRRVKPLKAGQVYQASLLYGQSNWICQLTYDGKEILLERLNPFRTLQNKSRAERHA